MTSSLTAVGLFLLILVALGLFFGRMGKFSFWKLAAQLPEQALEWFRNDPTWVVLSGDQSAPGEGFTGPFFVAVPSVGRIKVYARDDGIEQSQQRFVERYAALVPRRGFPYLSALALLYPVAAMLSLYNVPSPPIATLGYGFANLGYLLAAASIIPGHFRVLGLDARLPTLAAGVIFWVIGVVFSNVV
jgi:hypothetical protein